MDVHDLSPKELDELRDSYYYQLLDELDEEEMPNEITNDMLFEHYADISFVPDDFWCNQSDYIVEV